MFGVTWFLVFSLGARAFALGPFLYEHTCQQAIEAVRDERTRDDGGSADWYLPDSARCEIRPAGTRATWPGAFGAE